MTILTVTSTADAGNGSLRQAIANAQNSDTIVFDPTIAGQTITLASTLQITRGITIDGTGRDITISGNDAVTDFTVNNASSVRATLSGLTIANGRGVGANGQNATGSIIEPVSPPTAGGAAAGGVFAGAGKLSLLDDVFLNNTASGGNGGAPYVGGLSGGAGGDAAGAVYVQSTATVTASRLTFLNDTATGGSTPFGDIFGGTSGQGYSNSNSDAVNDAAVVCFVTGTLIRTTRGDIAVEDLTVGQLAVTASGQHRPIRWLGHRDIDCAAEARPFEVHPVRILAGAFGGGLPERDLYLSPGHPVLVGEGGREVLVPIMCLINGTSVARVPVETVTYWHVELEEHDILMAEGLPAESFLDYGNRPWFESGADHALANPDFIAPGLAGRCRPVAIEGPIVEAERLRLDALFETGLAAHCAWPSRDEAWATA